MLGFFYAQKQVLAMKDRITVFSIYITIKKIRDFGNLFLSHQSVKNPNT